MVQLITYSDINQSLQTNYVYDFNSVKQSINNLLLTRKGEREFLSEYGCDLEDYLFEIIDDQTTFLIQTEIIESITLWEPRIILDNSNTSVIADPDNHRYILKLVFRIKNLDSQNFQYIVGLSK